MKAHILTAAALLISSAGFASAADPGLPMESPPIGFNWTGGYVGAQVGYLWGETDQTDITSGSLVFSPDPDGVLAGLYVGYNHQFVNNLVLGVEADWAWSNADGRDTFFSEYTETELNWTGAVRARFGYAVDRFLPYIAGGVAFADYDHNLNGPGQFGDTYTGWTIGAGVEYAFTDMVIGRAEYRYTDFGSNDFYSDVFIDHEIDLSTNDIRLGIAYKF